MLSHTEAKSILENVAPSLTLAERLVVQGISLHETSYGSGWKPGHGEGSHNWGAIMTTSTNPADYFETQDSNPSGPFTGHFKIYPSDEAGALDVVNVGLRSNVRAAAARGDIQQVAQAMYDNHYFTGTSTDPGTDVRRYRDALSNAISQITAETGEANPFGPKAPLPPVSSPSDLPRLSLGCVGEAVQLVAALVDAPLSEVFTTELLVAVRTFQNRKGLKPDGIVGPQTWAALIVGAEPVN